MRRFDTVLFDLDGTLLDTLEDICGAANHTLRELGYPERTLAEMRRFVGNGAEMQMRRALGADADEETVAKALALYKPYYAAHCQIKTKPYAGVLELMAALKAEGFRLAVVSNKPDEAVRPLVAEHFGARYQLRHYRICNYVLSNTSSILTDVPRNVNLILNNFCIYLNNSKNYKSGMKPAPAA